MLVQGCNINFIWDVARGLKAWEMHLGIKDAPDLLSSYKLEVSQRGKWIRGKHFGTRKLVRIYKPRFRCPTDVKCTVIHEMVHAIAWSARVRDIADVPKIYLGHGEGFKSMLLDATSEYFGFDPSEVLPLHRPKSKGDHYSMDEAICSYMHSIGIRKHGTRY